MVAPVVNWTGFYIGADLGGLVQGGNGQSNFFQPDPNPLRANLRQNQPDNGSSFIGAVRQVTEDIARVGISYRFDPLPLVVAQY